MKIAIIAIVLLVSAVYAMEETTSRASIMEESPITILSLDDPKAVLVTGIAREHFKTRGYTMTTVEEVKQKQTGVVELFQLKFQATKDNEFDGSKYNCKASVQVSKFLIRGHQPVKIMDTECEKAQ